jgi:hypothetical protein
MKKTIISSVIITMIAVIGACGGGGYDVKKEPASSADKTTTEENKAEEANPKGIGEVKDVDLTDPLVESMIVSGEAIYEMKCAACHKLSDQRVVGPGWAGITNKRTPEWIMNMITNVDVMLEKDPEARKLLEECLTRMPNQGVSIGDARDILEFMRKNDLETVNEKDKAAV